MKIFTDYIANGYIYACKNILKTLVQNNVPSIWPLMPRIFCPLKFDFDCDLMGYIFMNFSSDSAMMNKMIYYCNLHINVKKEMLNKISGHKEEIYYKPNNIVALCLEVSFKLKFKSSSQVFEELDDKLKFIFDIKNESDMIDKISFYLCESNN